MATSFDVIGQRALSVIDDYKLRKLYDANIALFHDKIDGWVISSAAKFIECEQPLTYDSELRQFDEDLTNLEIQILAEYWVIYWWRGETDVATQIAQKLKVPSSFQMDGVSSQNFKEKQNVIDKLEEDVDRLIHDKYQLLYLSSYNY
jgi:hypothetical protein|nr:MAG TPA: hypothetical protein [Caudoviricetes sp.]